MEEVRLRLRSAKEDSVLYDDLFTCSICYLPFNDSENQPKLLNCHHTFCRLCLTKFTQDTLKLVCPVCAEESILGRKGVDSLSTNYYLYKFIYLLKNLDVNGQGIDATFPETSDSISCVKHRNAPKLFWCNTCSEEICVNCLGIDHSINNGHDVKDIDKVIHSLQENIKTNIEDIKKKITEMKDIQTAVDVENQNFNKTFYALNTIFEAPSRNCQNAITESMDPAKIVASVNDFCSSEKFQYDPSALTAMKKHLEEALIYYNTVKKFFQQTLMEKETLQKSRILLSILTPKIHFDYNRLYCVRCGELCTTRQSVKEGKDNPCGIEFTENCCKKCGIVLMEFN